MQRGIARTARLILAVVLVAPLAAQETPERSRTEGLKETDRFVKAGGKTSEAVEQAKLQTQKTLDAYNALVTKPSTNMKGDYKKVMKSADSMNDRVAAARLRPARVAAGLGGGDELGQLGLGRLLVALGVGAGLGRLVHGGSGVGHGGGSRVGPVPAGIGLRLLGV